MRYFDSRIQAGKLLAEKMLSHKKENCAIVSLSEGGVLIGMEIARRLHASLFLLTTEDVTLPGEPEPIATLSSAGTFTYNNAYSTGQLEALSSDYHNMIEGKRLEAFQKLNRISSEEGSVPKKLLKGHTVILVSDGLRSGLSLDVASDFLKPVKTNRLIIATPIASVSAVDRMHLVADEIQCLGVIEDYMNTDHYYKDNELPQHDKVIEIMQGIILEWDKPESVGQPSPE